MEDLSEIPVRLRPFFLDLDALSQAQALLFSAGSIGLRPFEGRAGVSPAQRGDVEIETLWAFVERSGWGTALVGLLSALADRHGVELCLRSVPLEMREGSIDEAKLREFYRGMGFAVTADPENLHMLRRPKDLTRQAGVLLDAAFDGIPVWELPSPALGPMA